MKHRLPILVFLCSLLITLSCSTSQAFTLADDVTAFTLPNGMRWILVPRHQAPVFSGAVMVRVGGTDEEEGKTGIAHMLEHMAFKGSKVLSTRDWKKEKPILEELSRIGRAISLERRKDKPDEAKITRLEERRTTLKAEHEKYYIKNEIFELMSRNGAQDMNAFTSKDVTAFHASLPVNREELWFAVLSQMVSDPVFREFYTERNVVAEERRTGIDNNPDGRMMEAILETAFQEGPYRYSTIGPAKDIQRYLEEDAKAFQETHYIPQLMVGVIVGDIDLKETKRLITKYFGPIPKGALPPQPRVPYNEGGGTATIALKAQPSVAIAYHKPTLPDPEEYVFDVATTLLCDGPTSRLYRELVIEKKLAQRVSCSDAFPGSRLPNLFIMWIEPMNGTKPQQILDIVDKELDRLKREPVSPDELKRVRTKVAASFLFALETNIQLAMALARYETIFNDWHLLIDYPERVAKVTDEDVEALARKYFKSDNRTIVIRDREKQKGGAR